MKRAFEDKLALNGSIFLNLLVKKGTRKLLQDHKAKGYSGAFMMP